MFSLAFALAIATRLPEIIRAVTESIKTFSLLWRERKSVGASIEERRTQVQSDLDAARAQRSKNVDEQ